MVAAQAVELRACLQAGPRSLAELSREHPLDNLPTALFAHTEAHTRITLVEGAQDRRQQIGRDRGATPDRELATLDVRQCAHRLEPVGQGRRRNLDIAPEVRPGLRQDEPFGCPEEQWRADLLLEARELGR